MKEKEFLTLFKAHIFNTHGTQSLAADHWGVSNNYVSLVVNGVKPPNQQMLNDVGLVMTKEVVKTTTRTYKKAA